MEQVTITLEEYISLLGAYKKLDALECSGVSGWKGYYDAMKALADNECFYD